jgi:murein DD-endopeptidase MepM/ murein hydrolase activator NlpD
MAWYDYKVTQGFKWSDHNKTGHSGLDLGAPWNTAVTAPLAGSVIFAQCKAWGGQVDILVNYSGRAYVATVLHLHSIMVNQGQSVVAGQLVGYSGGDTRGPCPTQMRVRGRPGGYSDGPHIHFEMTLGSLGPYHGGPPYKVNANSFTVDPTPLLEALRNGAVAGAVPGIGALFPEEAINTPVGLPGLDALFGIPQATVDAINAIPGIDNLIYRLHEAETFNWKGLDQVAPLNTATPSAAGTAIGAIGGIGGAIIAGTAGNAAQAAVTGILGQNLNPGRLAYWMIGNLFGNARAAAVRLLYVLLGGMLLLALVIALGSAQAESSLEQASQLVEAAKPALEAAAVAA